MFTSAGNEPSLEKNNVDHKLCRKPHCVLGQCMIYLIKIGTIQLNVALSAMIN